MNTPATPSTPLAAELHPAPAAPPVLDIVARIAECAPELREAERKVAAFILADLARARACEHRRACTRRGGQRRDGHAFREGGRLPRRARTEGAGRAGGGRRPALSGAVRRRAGRRYGFRVDGLRRDPRRARAQPSVAAQHVVRGSRRPARRREDDLRVAGRAAARPRSPTSCASGSCVSAGRSRATGTACCSGWWPRRCRATPSSSRCR